VRTASSFPIRSFGELPRLVLTIGPRERAVLATLRFPARRRDWRVARWTAKRLLAARLGADLGLATYEIRAGADGAPEVLVGGEPLPWPVSLSHRAGVAFVALGDRPGRLGCDVERVEPRSPAFLEDFLTAAERARVVGDPAPAVRAAVVWTAKESALKARREGLRADTRSVEVGCDGTTAPEGEWRPVVVRASAGETFHGWWRRDGALVACVVADAAFAPPPVSGAPT
jgi:4'-phosphopantetheinyl transferase